MILVKFSQSYVYMYIFHFSHATHPRKPIAEETIIINGDAHKRNENYLSNILWGSHRGSAAATEVTARCQNLPKIIYPKVNSYAKNLMKTAAEGNNVF